MFRPSWTSLPASALSSCPSLTPESSRNRRNAIHKPQATSRPRANQHRRTDRQSVSSICLCVNFLRTCVSSYVLTYCTLLTPSNDRISDFDSLSTLYVQCSRMKQASWLTTLTPPLIYPKPQLINISIPTAGHNPTHFNSLGPVPRIGPEPLLLCTSSCLFSLHETSKW